MSDLVVGGGLLGLWSASVLDDLGRRVDVLERGTIAGKRSPRMRTWTSDSAYFSTPQSGFVQGLGGRGAQWGGVVFDLAPAVEGRAMLAPDLLAPARKLVASHLEARDSSPNQVAAARSRTSLDLVSIRRSTGPFNSARLVESHPGIAVSTDTAVESIQQRLDGGWVVETRSGQTWAADKVVVACGAVENSRLVGSMILEREGLNDVWLPGLGDHAVVGLALRAPTEVVADLVGLDSWVDRSSEIFYPLIQIRPDAESSVVDVWALVEVGGDVSQGIRVSRERGGRYSAQVSYAPTAIDAGREREAGDVVLGLASSLASALGLSAPADRDVWAGLQHYDDLKLVDVDQWYPYYCPPGSVQHEYGPLATRAAELRREGLIVVGGAAFPRIGAFNPTSSFMVASTAWMSELVTA